LFTQTKTGNAMAWCHVFVDRRLNKVLTFQLHVQNETAQRDISFLASGSQVRHSKINTDETKDKLIYWPFANGVSCLGRHNTYRDEMFLPGFFFTDRRIFTARER
jgi:hypothetical protein